MFFYRVRLFSLFGFDVYVDASWLLLAVLIAWSLAIGVFPEMVSGLTSAIYWSMAVVATAGLMFSIVFHECPTLSLHGISHCRSAASRCSFSAVSPRCTANALSEFLMAMAGPIASGVLGLLLFLLLGSVAGLDGPPAISAVLSYLTYLNWVLAAFNLLPAFPLDGGRMLRAVLWGWSKDVIWATWIASGAGRLFGILLIVLGVVEVVRGDFVGGVWLALIGIFLRGAASATYEQTLARQILGGQPVSRFMNKHPITVSPDLSVRALLEDYVYRHHHKVFPVVREGRLLGCVTTAQISAIDEGQWDQRTVAEIMEPCSPDNTVAPETDTLEAMTKMQRTGRSPLLVVSRGQLVGMLSLRDLLELFALKLEIGEGRRQVSVQPQAG